MASVKLIFEGLDLNPIIVSVSLYNGELQRLMALMKQKDIKMDVIRLVELYFGKTSEDLRDVGIYVG